MRRRRVGWSVVATTAVVALLASLSGCSRPVDAGDAAKKEFELWLRANPSDAYDVVRVIEINTAPFQGTLDIVVSAEGPGPLEQRMSDAARALCEFQPKTEGVSLKGPSFREGRLTVPLACPQDGVAQWVFAVQAQADLLAELGTVPGIVSLDWRPDNVYATFDFGFREGADTERIARRIDAIAAAHPRAFPKGAEVSAYAGGGITD